MYCYKPIFSKSEIVTIFFGSQSEDNQAFLAFRNATRRLQENVFGHTDNKLAAKKYNLEGENNVIIYNRFEL